MIKIGVLGAGHLGKIHIKLLLELKDQFEFVGFFDPNDEKANETIEKFGIKRYNSVDELLNNVDAIDIVTPTLNHFECAQKALNLNKHVFVEKPLTNTIEEAHQLEQLIDNQIVQVGHVERFNGAFLSAEKEIKNPMFIESHRLAPFNERGTDVSVVLDLMIHDLDIILHTVNSPVKDIRASGVAVISQTPDIANARLEFENGCVANLTASRISLKTMRKMRLFQPSGYVSVDFGENQSEIFALSEEENAPGFEIALGDEKKKFAYSQPETFKNNAIKDELSEFHSAIKENRIPKVSFKDGKNALIVAHQILEKITQG